MMVVRKNLLGIGVGTIALVCVLWWMQTDSDRLKALDPSNTASEAKESVLRDTMRDERSIVQLLAAATSPAATGSGIQATAQISPSDCRRLAYHAWDGEPDAANPPAAQFNIAAERCAATEPVVRARLSARALQVALQREGEAIRSREHRDGHGVGVDDSKPSAELSARIKHTLMGIITDPELVRGTVDILSSFDDAIYVVVRNEGPEFADRFRTTWVNSLRYVARDAHCSESLRRVALATALRGEQELRAGRPLGGEVSPPVRRKERHSQEPRGESDDLHSDAGKKTPIPWTPADIERLREFAGEGLTVAAIALKLGRTYAAVTHRARREGIRFPSFRPRGDR